MSTAEHTTMRKTVPAGPKGAPRRKGKASNDATSISPPPKHSDRRIEMEWCRTHSLEKYAGQWVVLEKEDIIAHGDDAKKVVEEARRKGIEIPYLFRVEPDYSEDVVRMGL